MIFCAFGAELAPLRACVRAEQELDLEDVNGCHGTIGKTNVVLAASGIGMRRAQASARRVFDRIDGIEMVVLTGVAGALVDNLAIGDVVIADRLMTREGRGAGIDRTIEVSPDYLKASSTALEAAAIPHVRGALLTVRYPLTTGAEKRRAGMATGAIAVDMETAVIAAEAAQRGIPFVAIRTIMDTVEHDLAGAALADEEGNVRPLRAAAALVRNPAMVVGVVRLLRNLRQASLSMARAVEALAQRVG